MNLESNSSFNPSFHSSDSSLFPIALGLEPDWESGRWNPNYLCFSSEWGLKQIKDPGFFFFFNRSSFQNLQPRRPVFTPTLTDLNSWITLHQNLKCFINSQQSCRYSDIYTAHLSDLFIASFHHLCGFQMIFACFMCLNCFLWVISICT